VQRLPSEPLEARILPDDLPSPPRGSGAWKNWALALGAFALFVVCSGGVFWGLGQLINLGFSGPANKGSLIYSWETPEEQAANIAAAMNAKTTGASAAELRELNRFFTGLLEALAQEDHDSFRALVDQNAFAHRTSLHPIAAASGDFDQGALEEQLAYDLEGPRGWSRCQVVHVARGTAANEALGYVILTGEGQNPTPFRWWLRRSGRNWSVCDWEVIDCGHSEADRWARTRSIGSDPHSARYWQASAAIRRAQDENQAGKHGAVSVQLRDAEQQPLPAAVHDTTQIDLAIAWLNAARPDLALAAANRVSKPDAHIGSLHVQARALADLERQGELLKTLTQYRALAGCHPDLLQIEAEALEAQGKLKEAAECWWELLRLLPDDHSALFAFCRLADDQRRADIKLLLGKSKKPVERAAELATSAIVQDEVAAAEALLAFIRESDPTSLSLLELAALQHDCDQEHSLAAEQYLLAHQRETHPERKLQHFHRYLSSMAAANRAAAAYQAAEDKDAAFNYLTADHEYDESLITDKALAELIAVHRPRRPADPRLQYLSAKLLLDKGDYAAADAELLKAEAGADEELQGLIRLGRLEAIYRQGSIKDAYEAYPIEREDAFRELAWLANRRRDFAGLGELIGLHVRRLPGDPWIGYFTALREEAASNYTAALTALVPAEASADQGLQMLCTRLKTELYIKSDNVSQAYMAGGAPQQAFLRIAARLAELDDWNRVLSVAQLHGAAVPADAAALYYATKARWHLGQHDQLIQNLTPWPKDKLSSLDQAWVAEMGDLLVRSWLRSRPGEDARKAAELLRDELGLSLPLAMVELKLGGHERAKALLSDPLMGREFFLRQLQFDQECAAILTEPEFAELRLRYALERPSEYVRRSASLVLFLKQPLEEAVWREAFDRAAGDAAVLARDIPAADGDKSARTSRLVELPGGTLIVTARAAAYHDPKSISMGELAADSPLRKALEEHTAWIAIDLSLAEEQTPAKALEQAGQKLAAELLDKGALAIYVARPRRGLPQLLLSDVTTREQLENGSLSTESDSSEGGAVYLYEASGEQSPAEGDASGWRKLQRALRELTAKARVENAAGHARIRLPFQRGHARETLWLNVVRSKRGHFGSEEFIGEVTEASQLWPHLRTGEHVRVSAFEPLEVQPVP
jgi:hypothetical protein